MMLETIKCNVDDKFEMLLAEWDIDDRFLSLSSVTNFPKSHQHGDSANIKSYYAFLSFCYSDETKMKIYCGAEL